MLAGVALVAILAGRVGRSPGGSPPRPKPAPRADAPREEPTISLYVAQTGQTKRIKMEEYIAGVVAGEVQTDWPREVLAAQAVLARTFTMQKMSQGKTRHGTDASTDVKEFQAYAPEKINDAVRAAVQMTRGKVITYNGRYIRAYFHSCSGGLTATAQEGLDFREEPTPYLKVVKDPPCEAPEQQSWTATFSKAEVLAAARKLGANLSSLGSISIAGRGPSGRATRLALDGTTVSAPGFRVAIGPDRMKSTLLESLRLEGGRVVMRGKGWGHGVGMSQYGALARARQGWDHERIIHYYFKGVRIERLWR